jgi:hypothetical protein
MVCESHAAHDVGGRLDGLAVQRGYPSVLRCDNGPELACAEMTDWAADHVGLHLISPGQPWRNGYVESFDSRARGIPQRQRLLVTDQGLCSDQRV